ncbi:lipopolysaccharide assembly protein LapA domain-containing protein [Pseudomonas sp. VB3]|uniref:lipopolysaccharide assembly protein LapA domain-containing protein n=1 Tax=Pseudomonas sp. VB3 TaxID=2994641 RepID=UPI0022EC589D|nr:lipopolysaccharide assembly protein LapA domain-containing protein [Pseudomonas sp. VB3]
MRGFKGVILALLVLFVVLVILAFVLENQQGVALAFLGWTTPQMPVSVFVTVALIVGLVAGPVLGLVFGRKLNKSRISRST